MWHKDGFVLYDSQDFTYHTGDGEWAVGSHNAEVYPTYEIAARELKDCDGANLLGHRLHILGGVDMYNLPFDGPRLRYKGCDCNRPCLPFKCESKYHKGDDSLSPYCMGGHPGNECNDCWCFAEHLKKVAAEEAAKHFYTLNAEELLKSEKLAKLLSGQDSLGDTPVSLTTHDELRHVTNVFVPIVTQYYVELRKRQLKEASGSKLAQVPGHYLIGVNGIPFTHTRESIYYSEIVALAKMGERTDVKVTFIREQSYQRVLQLWPGYSVLLSPSNPTVFDAILPKKKKEKKR